MIIAVNFFITIVVCVTLYLTNLTVSKPNKNILLNTTLPIEELNNKEVLKIIKDFKKENNIYLFVNIALNIPSFIIKFESFFIIYLLSWIFVVMIIYYCFIKKYIVKLRKLKMERQWFTSEKHIVSVDTVVSSLKDNMPISLLWFIPCFLISIGIIIYALMTKNNNYSIYIILACTSIFTSLIFLVLYKTYAARKIQVYSNDSNINYACNLIYKRTWSIVYVLLATIQSIFTVFECFIYSQMIIISSLLIIIFIFTIFIAYTNIRNAQNKILMSTDNFIHTDDDDYWGIMFYNNPTDSNLMVEKRIGIGLTMNIGNPKAKFIIATFTIILAITLVPMIYIVERTTTAEFDFTVDDNKISIDAPIYSINFNKEDIKEISLISSLPNGTRTNGTGTSHIALGNYNFEGYGPSKSFVHKNLDKIIVIKLSDKYIFFTGNTDEETDEYYNEFQSYLDKN